MLRATKVDGMGHKVVHSVDGQRSIVGLVGGEGLVLGCYTELEASEEVLVVFIVFRVDRISLR
jgi:hypothetical protein